MQTDNSDVTQHPLLARQSGQVMAGDSVISLQLNPVANQNRYLVLCLSFDEAKSLWDEFSQHLQLASFDAWRLSEIRAGMPVIYPQTSEAFVLQMANLDLLAGVNFNKGCYPGQEIVARMQYLGKLKQRMYRAHVFTTQQVPRPGDAIHTPDLPGQTVGTVVDARCSPESGYDMLAVIHKSSVQEGSLYLSGDQEARLSIEDLPYSPDDLVRQ